MTKRKPLCRPWAVLTDGQMCAYLNNQSRSLFPLFHTRKDARGWIAISPYRAEHCTVVRVEVYVAGK